MSSLYRLLVVVSTFAVIAGVLAGPATAASGFEADAMALQVDDNQSDEDESDSTDESDDEDEDDDAPVVNIELDPVVDAVDELSETVRSFREEWDTTLVTSLFKPFQRMGLSLVSNVSLVLTNTPTVYPNSAVEEIHRLSLILSYLMSGIVLMLGGILYMIGSPLGISAQEVRSVLPRVFFALVFGTVSLPLLQLAVRFSDLLVVAFVPRQFELSLSQLTGLSTGLVLAWLINSVLLLGVVALFVLRSVYIMFGAAVSPLLALGWSIPRVRHVASRFIAGWFAALFMAPIDMLALRFSFVLLDGTANSELQALSNWVIGVASLSLLLLLPYQLWVSSQGAVAAGESLSEGILQQASSIRERSTKNEGRPDRHQRRSSRRSDNRYWRDDDE